MTSDNLVTSILFIRLSIVIHGTLPLESVPTEKLPRQAGLASRAHILRAERGPVQRWLGLLAVALQRQGAGPLMLTNIPADLWRDLGLAVTTPPAGT